MQKFLGIPVLILALFAACDDAGSDATDPGGAPDVTAAGITLSGTLIAGTQASTTAPRLLPAPLPASAPAALPAALESGDPLAGYQLYCVTFATPPAAASGTADASGQVALEIDAQGVPFGCFVLDADGNSVATMLFSAGTEVGQTVTLTGDADLGTITVDLGNGVAVTDVGDSGSLTGSSDLPCPLGAWTVQVPRNDCDGMATGSAWMIKTDDGSILASFTLGPVQLAGTDGLCGYHSDAGLPVTWADGKWSFSFGHDPTCPSRRMNSVGTPNADCSEAVVESTFGPCLACEDGACGCNEGTLTCTASYTLTRL